MAKKAKAKAAKKRPARKPHKIAKIKDNSAKILTEDKAEKLLSRYLPVAKSVLTKNAIQAIEFSNKIGFPLVLKIISRQALHKSEAGGVRIVNNIEELRKAYADMMKSAVKNNIKVDGMLAQEFINGQEVIIGIKYDATFGHVIGFGTGGKYTELLKDIAFRACPITEEDAQSMIDELKLRQLLYGARGSKPVNIKLLKQIMVKASKIPATQKRIQELDINPFIINEKTGKVADARILMK